MTNDNEANDYIMTAEQMTANLSTEAVHNCHFDDRREETCTHGKSPFCESEIL